MFADTVCHGRRPTTPGRGWRFFSPSGVVKTRASSAIEQLAAQGIEIVDVVFMAEEDGVDGGAVRGFGQLGH